MMVRLSVFFLIILLWLWQPIPFTAQSSTGPAARQLKTDSMMRRLGHLAPDTTRLATLISLSVHMIKFHKPAEVFPFAEKARRLGDSLAATARGADKQAVTRLYARALVLVGVLYSKKASFDSSLSLINQGLRLYQKIGYKPGIASAYSNLGAVNSDRQNYLEALRYQLKALQIREDMRDSAGMGASHYNLSEIHRRTGNDAEAVKHGEKAIIIREKIRDMVGLAESLQLMGAIHFQFYRNREALSYFRKALELNKGLGYVELEAITLQAVGNVFQDSRQLDSSILYYQRSIALSRQLGQAIQVARTTLNMGRAYFEGRNYQKARELMMPLEDTLKRYEQKFLLEDLYYHLAMCDTALGMPAEAMKFAWLNRDMALENYAARADAELKELQMKYDLEKKEKENTQLATQNRIQKLELGHQRLLLAGLGIAVALLGLLFMLLYQRHRTRASLQVTELQHKLLRTQMNPHFIFNALQAIQNFIHDHHEREAGRYLEAFASLTRDVLENSRSDLIPLRKELDLLRNYLELQKLRFGDRFEYGIHVAENAETMGVALPPMLSQPFIENAVEHGLSEMESGGRIDLYFRTEAGFLFMDIIDNGRGIVEDDAREKDHRSLAIQITRERIDLLNKRSRKKSSFVVSPAELPEKDRPGVKVAFKIALAPASGNT